MKIIGRGHCRWRTGAGNTNKTNIGEEYYLNEKTFFVGGESGTLRTKHFFVHKQSIAYNF